MKLLRRSHAKMRRSTWFVVISLMVFTIAVIVACGKLSNESQQPTSPSGTSGGNIAIPIGDQRCWGTYCLSLSASPGSIPADGVTYTGLKATLTDTSGRSLENFLVTFSTKPTSDGIAYFVPWLAPELPLPFAPEITGLTHSGGSVSVRMYGAQSGSVVVQATVDINKDGVQDLFTTTVVVLTPSSGDTSSAGSYRLSLTADPMTIVGNGIDFSTLTAQVTDSSGGSVSGLSTSFAILSGTGTLTPTFTTTDQQGRAHSQFRGVPPSGGSILIVARVQIPDLRGSLTAMIRISVISVAYTPTPGPTAAPTATAQPTVTPTATPTPIPVTYLWAENPVVVDAGDKGFFRMSVSDPDGAPLSGVLFNLTLSPTSARFESNGEWRKSEVAMDGNGETSDWILSSVSGITYTMTAVVAPGQGYSGSGKLEITFLP